MDYETLDFLISKLSREVLSAQLVGMSEVLISTNLARLIIQQHKLGRLSLSAHLQDKGDEQHQYGRRHNTG